MSNVFIDIDDLLRGSIDMHLHHGPDTMPARFDALELANLAQKAGMRGIVLKSHWYPTAPLAEIINKTVPDVTVFGSISLDRECGGLNFHVLETSAKLGAKVVWMPTFSAANSINKMKALGIAIEGEGSSILDAQGKPVPQLGPVLSLVKQYGMVLASGHISPAETFVLMEEALRAGIQKLVITHPLDAEFVEQAMSLDELQQLANMGAYIELTFVSFLPTVFSQDPKRMVEAIKAIGAKHCIMSTDLGWSTFNPPPAEGMRLFIGTLLGKGITPEEIELMVKVNPAKLLDLE